MAGKLSAVLAKQWSEVTAEVANKTLLGHGSYRNPFSLFSVNLPMSPFVCLFIYLAIYLSSY